MIVLNDNETNVNLTEKNNKKIFLIIISVALLLVIGTGGYLFFVKDKDKNKPDDKHDIDNVVYLTSPISGNSIEDFDLSFLKMESKKENKIYSPLSIKYALGMLSEGANNASKEQIANVIGTYNTKKYINSNNLSLANALFIKDTFKSSINESYINTLLNKYDAEVIYDTFKTSDSINNWISNKTFKNIENLVGDVSEANTVLVNALALDMEWINKIQHEQLLYLIEYEHRDYYRRIDSINDRDYSLLDFDNFKLKAKSAEIGAVINKYDIVNIISEQKIRETVGEEYRKYLAEMQKDDPDYYYEYIEKDVDKYLDKYIEEIKVGYKDISSSTDFSFYTDDNVKVFAKDLKTYDNTTLQYVGIMPQKETLINYLNNVKASDINNLIASLKTIEIDNFKEGVVTEISGFIPMFKFEYDLNLKDDLQKLGIKDIFDINKADLFGITSNKFIVDQVLHKANIEFSNDGITAAAAVTWQTLGDARSGFDYIYDVPVEEIDLTFNMPYLFLIRDKDSGEIWFTGTVYNPIYDYEPGTGQD